MQTLDLRGRVGHVIHSLIAAFLLHPMNIINSHENVVSDNNCYIASRSDLETAAQPQAQLGYILG